tara:strand:+ start:3111 stop:3785 length:675 start_codon:yes stop_codon:yes gene_type:complete
MEIITDEQNDEHCFIKYIPNFLDQSYIDNILEELKGYDYIGGKTDYGTDIPRVQKWMHNDNQPFSLLWKKQFARWQPKNYTPHIRNLQDNIIEIYSRKYKLPEYAKTPKINSSLVNTYRDGKDSISFHRDNLPEFGINPTIMVVSFGETRKIQFRRVKYNILNPKSMKLDNDLQHQNFNIDLEEGSLLVMGGVTQKYFAHGIDKCSTNNIRYSITFREHASVNY